MASSRYFGSSREEHRLEELPVDLNHDSGSQSASPEQSRNKWSHEQTRILISSCILQLPIWGFAMGYGVVQDFYNSKWTFGGNRSSTGVIGTTFNGIIYISMPLLFAAFTQKYARYRRAVAVAGAIIACISYLLAAFSNYAWQLIATQGVLAAIGSGFIYAPCTLSLGEWFSSGNRALAYGLTLSSKNIVGSACPFLLQYLLNQVGFKLTLLIWSAMTFLSSLIAIWLMPDLHPLASTARHGRTSIPWHFLKHYTFYMYSFAILLQSSGYGIPQTYLTTYAHDTGSLNPTSATLLLTLFNLPGILSSSMFGWLSDKHDKSLQDANHSTIARMKLWSMTPTSTTLVSSLLTSLSAFLLWGLAPRSSLPLLILFSIIFGFFAGGYSATWGGVISELESEAAKYNEALDSGLIYGLLNGARGVGYVGGGLVGLALLNIGVEKSPEDLLSDTSGNGYQTEYWAVILFTGISTVFGGAGVVASGGRLCQKIRAAIC